MPHVKDSPPLDSVWPRGLPPQMRTLRPTGFLWRKESQWWSDCSSGWVRGGAALGRGNQAAFPALSARVGFGSRSKPEAGSFRLFYSVKLAHRAGAHPGLWGLPDSLRDLEQKMVFMGTPGRRGAALESHLWNIFLGKCSRSFQEIFQAQPMYL